jgi:4-hydroxy-4-methyl-2-oxoglutarate aldolase
MTAHDDALRFHTTAAALLVLGAATLGESGGQPMRSRIRAVWRGAKLSAPAFPVRCTPGDNLAIHVAVATAPPGHVLVVDVGDREEFGYWGEVLTTGAEARGLAGLVIDGGVRDVAALEAHGFAVFSTTVALRGAAKQSPGAVGAPAVVGGVEVATGDWVVGDTDGVTVIAADSLGDVLAAGRARADKEEGLFAALADGATTVDLLGLDPSCVKVTLPVEARQPSR